MKELQAAAEEPEKDPTVHKKRDAKEKQKSKSKKSKKQTHKQIGEKKPEV